MLPLADERKIPLMMLAVSLPDIASASEWASRVRNLGSEDEAIAMADYLAETPTKTIAVAYINDEFGVGAVEVFREAAGRKGLSVIIAEPYDKAATDFRTLAATGTGADALYVIGYVNASVLLIKQYRELGGEAQILGNMALSVPSFLALGGAALDSAVFTITEFDAGSDRAEVRRSAKPSGPATARSRRSSRRSPTTRPGWSPAKRCGSFWARPPRRCGRACSDSETTGGSWAISTSVRRRDQNFPTRVVKNIQGKIVPVEAGLGARNEPWTGPTRQPNRWDGWPRRSRTSSTLSTPSCEIAAQARRCDHSLEAVYRKALRIGMRIVIRSTVPESGSGRHFLADEIRDIRRITGIPRAGPRNTSRRSAVA